MYFYRSTIEINGFSMVFPNSGTMVSDGLDLEKKPKNVNNRDRSYSVTTVSIISDSDHTATSNWVYINPERQC